MSLRSDHKALMFLGAVGVLGAGVRVVRAAGKDSIPAVQPALEHQASVADSAASAQRAGKGRGKGAKKGRGGRGGATATPPDAAHELPRPQEHAGHARGRLDLDLATAAQIDSLPGVSSTMARRIAVDRARRGPFTNSAGLQRVSGVGKRFLQQIDSLVTFSGTFAFVNPNDTIVKSRRKSRK